MKLLSPFLLPLVFLAVACSKSQQNGDSNTLSIDSTSEEETVAVTTDSVATPADLTDEELLAYSQKIVEALPDHGDYSPQTRQMMTPEFYRLTVQGFEAPTNNPGGIGDEEDLYIWYGSEDCEVNISGLKLMERTEKSATISVNLSLCGEKYTHTLKLEKRGDTWQASDFDDLKRKFRAYIKLINKALAGDGAYALLQEADIEPDDEFFGKEYIREVTNYKKKYGIK